RSEPPLITGWRRGSATRSATRTFGAASFLSGRPLARFFYLCSLCRILPGLLCLPEDLFVNLQSVQRQFLTISGCIQQQYLPFRQSLAYHHMIGILTACFNNLTGQGRRI